jgi:hypothetical protein
MPLLASNLEVLIKTEPYLKFKKNLFKVLAENSELKEEALRRKFYKLLDTYLSSKEIDKKEYKGVNLPVIIQHLDLKFKNVKEGSFIRQGSNLGYIKDSCVVWVRFNEIENQGKIEPFL